MERIVGLLVSLVITLGIWGLLVLDVSHLSEADIDQINTQESGWIYLAWIIVGVVSTVWTARLAHYLVTGERKIFDD